MSTVVPPESAGPVAVTAAALQPPAPDSHRGRLYRKYLLLIMTLVDLALLASGAISLVFSYRGTSAALASLQQEKAVGAAERIEQYLRQAPEVTDIALIDHEGRALIAESRLGMSMLA